jgi:putative ATP-binding cassette transporter
MKLIAFLLHSAKEVRYSRSIVLVVILAGFIAGACNAGLLAVVGMTLGETRPGQQLWLKFIALCIAMLVSRIVSGILLLRLSQGVMFDLRLRLSRQILGVPLRNLELLGAHRLLATLTTDISTISEAIRNVPVICMHIAIVIGCLVYLGWLSWGVLLAIVGFMVLGSISYQVLIMKGAAYLNRAREQWDELYKDFSALTEGSKELKLHYRRRQTFLSQNLQSSATALRQHNVTANSIFTVAISWGQLLIIGLLLYALPSFRSISIPTLTAYAITLLYMMSPLEVILNSLPGLSNANVALRKVEKLGISLDDQATETDRGAPREPEPHWESLELSGVKHTYYRERENSVFTLGPLDLTLNLGELIFLVGGNGSGKTTLAKLLAGLYIPESGEIRLNGQLITDDLREHYRQYFSVVFSDFFLFESLLGLDDSELDSKARDYLSKLQLEHKVNLENGVLSTTDLSQGQRKRLALLTAYLENRPIYIFDEWAADQDPLFKEIFYYQLLPELKARNKTVVVISHDDRYYHVADRIVKLDFGEIVRDEALTGSEQPLIESPLQLG